MFEFFGILLVWLIFFYLKDLPSHTPLNLTLVDVFLSKHVLCFSAQDYRSKVQSSTALICSFNTMKLCYVLLWFSLLLFADILDVLICLCICHFEPNIYDKELLFCAHLNYQIIFHCSVACFVFFL